MSELIPSISWGNFVKIAEQGRLEELKSSEVIVNGKHLFTAIIFHGDMFAVDAARTQSEYVGARSNTELGKYPEEILAEIQVDEPTLHDRRVAAMAHAREAKKQKQLVGV
mgnify:CR=1 FL=1